MTGDACEVWPLLFFLHLFCISSFFFCKTGSLIKRWRLNVVAGAPRHSWRSPSIKDSMGGRLAPDNIFVIRSTSSSGNSQFFHPRSLFHDFPFQCYGEYYYWLQTRTILSIDQLPHFSRGLFQTPIILPRSIQYHSDWRLVLICWLYFCKLTSQKVSSRNLLWSCQELSWQLLVNYIHYFQVIRLFQKYWGCQYVKGPKND